MCGSLGPRQLTNNDEFGHAVSHLFHNRNQQIQVYRNIASQGGWFYAGVGEIAPPNVGLASPNILIRVVLQ